MSDGRRIDWEKFYRGDADPYKEHDPTEVAELMHLRALVAKLRRVVERKDVVLGVYEEALARHETSGGSTVQR